VLCLLLVLQLVDWKKKKPSIGL